MEKIRGCEGKKGKVACVLSIATFVEVKNDNSISTFPQGFTRLIHTHLPKSDYQLLDFGGGRKLERLGDVLVDRPCPTTNSTRENPALWRETQLSYDLSEKDRWHNHNSWKGRANESASPWICLCGEIQLQIKPTPAGQLGIFPEHWTHWEWLRKLLFPHNETTPARPRVLSLFAYTGATTLALARLGCEVTHVDAAKPTVQWARENCKQSGLSEAPIRWIVDDAVAFVKRELRRNKQYEAILLDPPTYGHGIQGDRWEIHRDLIPLMDDCWQLLSDQRRLVLLCGHSSHVRIRDINTHLAQRHGRESVIECEVAQAYLCDLSGRKLDCGFAAKYSLG